METIVGYNCTFNSDSTRGKIADGLINYILYHNEVIRQRSDQRTYLQEHFGNLSYDPYPTTEYITFQDRVHPTLDDKKKPVRVEKTKKFISVSTNIKKWLGFICSRLAFEADSVFGELTKKLSNGSTNTNDLDSVMFSKCFEFNLFRLVAKIVSNNEFTLKKFMNIQLLETDIANKIKERYDVSHPLRQYNKNVADWLGKLLDDFFKVIAVHVSLKNWFDRDATISEKNLPAILWILAENTEYYESLYDFLSYVVPNTTEEKVETSSENLITFDMSNLSEVAQAINNTKLEPAKKSRAKKVDPSKIVTIPALSVFPLQPVLTQLTMLPAQPILTQPTALPAQQYTPMIDQQYAQKQQYTAFPPMPQQYIMPAQTQHYQ